MITAFYVDNAPNLPLWRKLPPLALWILPTLIGAPILINALLHHPLVRQLGGESRNGSGARGADVDEPDRLR
jgi:hypothetical protein